MGWRQKAADVVLDRLLPATCRSTGSSGATPLYQGRTFINTPHANPDKVVMSMKVKTALKMGAYPSSDVCKTPTLWRSSTGWRWVCQGGSVYPASDICSAPALLRTSGTWQWGCNA